MNNEKQSGDFALVKQSDLALVTDNVLNEKQLAFILKKTPKQYIRKRPAKGGGEWEYVPGAYVKKCLNLMFGWNWDFEILNEAIADGEAIVKGRLTVRTNGQTLIKTQIGNHEVIYKKTPAANGDRIPLSRGNDLKSAATDALKKCAEMLGIASDVYNKEDFKEVTIMVDVIHDWWYLAFLFESNIAKLAAEEVSSIKRIIENKEEGSYNKVLSLLNLIDKKATRA